MSEYRGNPGGSAAPRHREGCFPQLDGSEIELEADGLLARVIQHETDHLNGVLFVDRVSAATKLMLRRELKRLKN